jgi:lipoprotein-anchoring transpeptidase ErfK/SrfK
MVDYYAILSRAVRAPGASDGPTRRVIYDRARHMLAAQLRERRPPVPRAEAQAHTSALEAAIERIEGEFARAADHDALARDDSAPGQPDEYFGTAPPAHQPAVARLLPSPLVWLAFVAAVVAALGVGAYALWPKAPGPAAERKVEAPARVAAPRPVREPGPKVAVVEDIAPGVDGGSTDAGLPYFYRRQPVFYRTTHPPGTIIVDKGQRFLYLTQPNSVALRYGIAVGLPCAGLGGLRRVIRKAEWPQWQPPQDMVERKLVKAGVLAGGPGNPLGARVLDLDDDTSRIHGTNAPKTISNAVALGCLRLVNDDIVDLYGRVPLGTRVILSD